ncbi:MAG TPA: metallophosphoesterase, partial [Streptomyces sp.]|nr:metallophosphoesterase [Streptomyces sp.]
MAFLLLNILAIPILVGVHWYLWRRLVKNVSRKGGPWRRTGTVLVWLLSGTSIGTLVAVPAGAPFEVVRVLAWPGYLWLALLLYLSLALLLGELARPLLRKGLGHRAAQAPVEGSSVSQVLRATSPAHEPATPVLAGAAAETGTGGNALEEGGTGLDPVGPPTAPDGKGENPEGETPGEERARD